MHTGKVFFIVWVITILAAVACAGPPTPTQPPAGPSPIEVTPQPTEPPPVAPGETAAPTAAQPPPEPSLETIDTTPQRIDFTADDNTALVGTFWPSAEPSAPGILLMHWARGDMTDWYTFGTLLQGQAIAQLAPGIQPSRSYAVFAFDFRGFGQSKGKTDWPSNISDARKALEVFRSLPGVDPEAIIMIGASIGADAAVDACGEGCIGAVALSPGGFLGTPYHEALAALGDKPVLCVASQDDGPSPDTCRAGESAGLSDYQVHIYLGPAHGMDMFNITEQVPALTDMLFEWIHAHTP